MQKHKLSLMFIKVKRLMLNSCLVLLLLVGIIFLACPTVSHETYAETSGYISNTNVSIAVTSLDSLELRPDFNQGLNTSTSQIIVSTNSPDGFSILLSSHDNNLTSADTSDTTNFIQSLNKASTPADFDDNTWGYYIGTESPNDGTIYQPIPIDAATILDSDEAAASQSYQLSFGAKVDTELSAGIYNTTLLISAVANPTKMGALSQITYLQEMTHEICANTANYVDKEHYATKQLIDSRDNKKYWVAKLADGNCWMVQNLALDIPSDYKTKFNNTNTDIPVNMPWPYGMQPTTNVINTSMASSNDNSYSWNFGKFVLATPTRGDDCGQVNTANISQCRYVGFIQIDDSWTDDFVATDGLNYAGVNGGIGAMNNTFVAADPAKKSYDAHYLIGNYYQFTAALASSGGLTGIDASYSICPSGWKLPVVRTDGSDANLDSYRRLFSLYGVNSKPGGDGGRNDDNSLGYNIAKAPLYMVRSGRVYTNIKYLYYFGNYGYEWTSRASSNAFYGTNIVFSNTVVNASSDDSRVDGFPIRCLAR